MLASDFIVILLLLVAFFTVTPDSLFTPQQLTEMGICLENSSTPETI